MYVVIVFIFRNQGLTDIFINGKGFVIDFSLYIVLLAFSTHLQRLMSLFSQLSERAQERKVPANRINRLMNFGRKYIF